MADESTQELREELDLMRASVEDLEKLRKELGQFLVPHVSHSNDLDTAIAEQLIVMSNELPTTHRQKGVAMVEPNTTSPRSQPPMQLPATPDPEHPRGTAMAESEVMSPRPQPAQLPITPVSDMHDDTAMIEPQDATPNAEHSASNQGHASHSEQLPAAPVTARVSRGPDSSTDNPRP
ncbi:hypothetical protein LCI18_001692 [Fusarium solani-melongenae]|uniref:Uncharacterized protein n=1 Tax=Fusarium solani subsp. cucurbitae TaxID=2747967 RepID=A0ACD3YP74_FUSSC|nr:hypothetical protein LCI18_001692 [Fusarium solani-melongenae]